MKSTDLEKKQKQYDFAQVTIISCTGKLFAIPVLYIRCAQVQSVLFSFTVLVILLTGASTLNKNSVINWGLINEDCPVQVGFTKEVVYLFNSECFTLQTTHGYS